jgi:site-specific DNA recombinase
VGKMLRNPIYKGRRDYGSGRASGGTNRTGREPVRQQYPAIVSEELWQQAQDVMEVNEQNSGRNNKKHQYLLRRLLFCTHCLTVDGQYRRFAGAPSTSKTGKTLLYYVCPATQQAHQHHVEGLTPCPFGYLRADELEADMWEKLEARIRDSEGTLAKIRARAETQDDRRDALLKARDARRRQKVAKENEKREAVRLATGGVLTEAEMKERLEELRREIGELETDLQRLDRECHNLALTEAQLTEAEGWLDVWRAKIEAPLTWEEKRQVVEQFVKEILVTAGEGGGTEIVYRFCYDPNAKPLARIARPMLGRSRTGTGSCRRS